MAAVYHCNDSRGESARNGKHCSHHVFTHVFVPLVMLPKLTMHKTAFGDASNVN